MTSDTSARPSERRAAEPANTMSSIFCARTTVGDCMPSTQAMASTTLDLPLPLGPTTTFTPGSNAKVVVSAKDLKPFMVKDLRYMRLSAWQRLLVGEAGGGRDGGAGMGGYDTGASSKICVLSQ